MGHPLYWRTTMARRQLGKPAEDKVQQGVNSVKESGEAEFEPKAPKAHKQSLMDAKMLSTGSTLLDLAISSGRKRGGGIPGNLLMEIYGTSGCGKTSILSELCGSAQYNGGEVMFLDPESRLDEEYCKIYGVNLDKKFYHRPNTVTELFDYLTKFNPQNDKINVLAADSLAALSTDLEMEKGDKMGMRRAKELSEGLRKTARLIGERNQIIACSNQLRQGDYGKTTPGGVSVGYYASLRIEMRQVEKLEVKKKLGEATVSRIIGIESHCKITKSSIDRPFRECPVYIIFDMGIDDIRGNLQWLKDTKAMTKYPAVDVEYARINDAINYIESSNLEESLRNDVIDLWDEIEAKFVVTRKKTRR